MNMSDAAVFLYLEVIQSWLTDKNILVRLRSHVDHCKRPMGHVMRDHNMFRLLVSDKIGAKWKSGAAGKSVPVSRAHVPEVYTDSTLNGHLVELRSRVRKKKVYTDSSFSEEEALGVRGL